MPAMQTLESGTQVVRGSKKANGNLLDGERHEGDPFPGRLTTAEIQQHRKLSTSERKEWRKSLKTIEKGWKTFVEVGLALRAIRQSRLYREDYESWDAFCRDVVGLSKTEANRQINDVEVVESLQTPNGVMKAGDVLPLPANRAQVRALSELKDANARRQVWAKVQKVADDAPITARVIADAVAAVNKPLSPGLPEPPRESGTDEKDLTVGSEEEGIDVVEMLRCALREKDWSLVESVIQHFESKTKTKGKKRHE